MFFIERSLQPEAIDWPDNEPSNLFGPENYILRLEAQRCCLLADSL